MAGAAVAVGTWVGAAGAAGATGVAGVGGSGDVSTLTFTASWTSEEALRNVSTVGFLSHVQKDLAVAAREAGCDRIVARSAFTRDLPKILAGDTPDSFDEACVG